MTPAQPELVHGVGGDPAGGHDPAGEDEPARGDDPAVQRWRVVIPVKPARRGKSRLASGASREGLARAIALDTIAAAASCPVVAQVFVVTDDAGLPLAAADIPGLRFVAEEEARGLDAAIALGMAAAGTVAHRAALLGDLPALRPDDLAAALDAATAHPRSVVADAEGTGSTLVTATAGVEWTSAFGDGSFARHLEMGCVAIDIPRGSTVRRDVDTPEQLETAATLGVGPHTAALL
ncbi:2-phospho-L-lactate guanylyltransferase [Microbacterium sp. UBA3394]|uniref:2-phospho-L-lactate guanylyltransferase n=1 Tax=Microbacterium sp. UBA3394 TaxID=1946945 RepID=UPI000C531245|nr:2-phospho-L-lactate guanylyltransferase [Microbacterium sp. UBA3394]MAB19560.1 2-phospho-L-lactate guanylyltransferase [Microbacterium sp.]|tara:strand:+ start:5069 stop:5776 length:708 start_codon:yes stop_codon:yes gene_type:complete